MPSRSRAKLHDTAVRLSTHYLNKLLSRNPRHRPWNINTPVEETRVYSHFVETAKLVEEVEAAPKDWVAAQFEWFTRFGKHKFPYPTQLHTENARLRYIEYIEHKTQQVLVTAKPEHKSQKDPFKLETVKARSLAKRFKVSVQEVLKLMPREFTRGFHEQQGTWDDVAAGYED